MASHEPHSRPAGAAGHGSYRSGFAFGMLSFVAMLVIGLLSAVATARLYGVRIVGQFALASAPVAALWVLSTVKEESFIPTATSGESS